MVPVGRTERLNGCQFVKKSVPTDGIVRLMSISTFMQGRDGCAFANENSWQLGVKPWLVHAAGPHANATRRGAVPHARPPPTS